MTKYICVLVLLCSCYNGRDGVAVSIPGEFRKPGSAKFRVGLVLSSFGLGDESFNDMQYNGLIEAYRRFNIDISFGIAEKETVSSYKKIFSRLLDRDKCDIILAFHGFMMSRTVSLVAPRYPEIPFIVINYPHRQYPNVYVCSFATEEGSFLCGYLASRMASGGRTAMIMGTDIPALEIFRRGFVAGVYYGNAVLPPVIRYCSRFPDFSGFDSPKRGYAMARKLYGSGVNVIYSVAGATGNGIIQAARDVGKYAIGVDTDQDAMAPGLVLTSMMKRFDVVVYTMVSNYIKKQLGNRRKFIFNLENGGISLSAMQYTKKKIPVPVLRDLERLKRMIVRKGLRIPR